MTEKTMTTMAPYWEVMGICDQLGEAARCSRWDDVAQLGEELRHLAREQGRGARTTRRAGTRRLRGMVRRCCRRPR